MSHTPSYVRNPGASVRGVEGKGNDNTPENTLERAVFAILNYNSLPLSDHEFPITKDFLRWKNFWHQKISILWHRAEGKSWPEITRWFQEKGIVGKEDAWHHKWQRVSVEVSTTFNQVTELIRDKKVIAMVNAFEADSLNENARICNTCWMYSTYEEAVIFDSVGRWDRVVALMKDYGSVAAWTSAKVEYAWLCGASTLRYKVGFRMGIRQLQEEDSIAWDHLLI
jgi:hypothetical protein